MPSGAREMFHYGRMILHTGRRRRRSRNVVSRFLFGFRNRVKKSYRRSAVSCKSIGYSSPADFVKMRRRPGGRGSSNRFACYGSLEDATSFKLGRIVSSPHSRIFAKKTRDKLSGPMFANNE